MAIGTYISMITLNANRINAPTKRHRLAEWIKKQDQELTVTQIMNSLLSNSDLKRVGKTTRPFRYDLNQFPYDYTVEVTNRFKGLDLIGRMPEELWTEVHGIVQKTRRKTIPKKKKGKMVV